MPPRAAQALTYMTTEQAQFLAEFLLPQLESEHRANLRILAAIPAEQHDYRPNPKAMSALELARHIVICEIWFLDGVLQGRFGEFPVHLTTQDYEAAFGERFERFRALDGERLTTPLDFHGLRTEPAVTFLSFAIRHSVHHRGQLSTYLRAMGAHVPAIYVESADEPDLAAPPAF